MSTKYFALLTQLGADKLANAAALGTKLAITQMAVGDGGGVLPTPDTTQTKLVNERRRATINTLNVDPKNAHQIIAEQVIPESEGGWWIREIGLFDQDGVLIAVGNCPETYKPQLQEGSGRTQTIRMVLIVSHTDAVTLKIDPSVVLATREYTDATVKKAITEHEKSRRHPDATLKEKGLVILSSALDSQSESQAATSKAVKAVHDLVIAASNNANTRLEKEKNGADISDKNAFINNLGLAAMTTMGKHIVTFTQAGVHTWDVPDELRSGALNAHITVYGGGGGGGFYHHGGGGGGGGGLAESSLSLRGINSITITVGSGGRGATSHKMINSGSTSLFGNYLSATGGHGASAWLGGRSGIGISGQVNCGTGAGHNATRHDNSNSQYGGGNGGGMNGGAGSGSGTPEAFGYDGELIGSGGGGGNENGIGGNGSAGAVIIRW
ncbi:phage tail protein [Xenorhabdus szentirmaii]|uniref:Uncharacterized protein n=2 Tax=Xenorhabdus szentirmaii TaxID=290112 RepID=W1J3T6_9GAMM|nr:phage tail protein [Xenorhabdus szentirmaii]PHM34332.1 phage tail protein [Xenorhabdus szentirmaii DSM 16338]CDL84115.1 hypothetical protein XSR1_40144 [Xenorhabdus szentirmaii DSM 16338]